MSSLKPKPFTVDCYLCWCCRWCVHLCLLKVVDDSKGKVVDVASEEVLIGVTVKEVGSSRGTVTDLDGNFVLQVKPNSSVEISYVSFKTKTYKANAIPKIIRLEESVEAISEVVVVGYGSQKKVNLWDLFLLLKAQSWLPNQLQMQSLRCRDRCRV